MTVRQLIHNRARGFTLLEALVASVILGASVMAVISALSTSQQLAHEGQKRVLGAMACNDLLIEAATLPYANLRTHAGLNQSVGLMQTLDGGTYPASFWALGRTMTIAETTITDTKSGAVVKGVKVIVSAIDEENALCSIEAFFAEPQGGGS
ncbi:MAG: prepilin-type N-terminal cleavage/methylation domain-containing protein [Phycisphaerales bacterium]